MKVSVSFEVMKMAWNYIVLIVAPPCKYREEEDKKTLTFTH